MKNNLRRLCEGAIMVAIAQILSYIKLWEMPWGGSIVLAMVPIILFSVRWGLGSGLLAGFVFGVLQFMFDGGFAIGWQSIIGDYLLAFTVLGLAGLTEGQEAGRLLGHPDRRRCPVPGTLCGWRNHLGRLYARYLLRHDHDLSLDLLPALQHRLHGPQHHHYAGDFRSALCAHEEVYAGSGYPLIFAVSHLPRLLPGENFSCPFPATDAPPQIDFRGGLCYTGGQRIIPFFIVTKARKSFG